MRQAQAKIVAKVANTLVASALTTSYTIPKSEAF